MMKQGLDLGTMFPSAVSFKHIIFGKKSEPLTHNDNAKHLHVTSGYAYKSMIINQVFFLLY